MPGRIGVYMHSDSVTPDKGGCLVLVNTTTDFASRTPEVKKFADMIAKHAYGASAGTINVKWKHIVTMFPDMENERAKLAEELKEEVVVSDIKFLKVT